MTLILAGRDVASGWMDGQSVRGNCVETVAKYTEASEACACMDDQMRPCVWYVMAGLAMPGAPGDWYASLYTVVELIFRGTVPTTECFMRHLLAASLLASFGLAATQAQAATAPRQVFVDACKSAKAQAADSGPEAVRAKPAVRAVMAVAGGNSCDAIANNASALTELDISGKELTDISVLGFMNNLTVLNISNNKIKDISSLSKLTKLTKLNAAQNQIVDISVVANFAALQTLNVSKNNVADIGAIKDLAALKTLRADGNQIGKVFAISNVKTLNSVNLNSNKIENLAPLAKNKKLKDLKVKGNPVKNCPDGKKVEVKGKEIENTELLRGICKDEAYKGK